MALRRFNFSINVAFHFLLMHRISLSLSEDSLLPATCTTEYS